MFHVEYYSAKHYKPYRKSPHGVMVKILGSGLKVNKFKLQLHFYIHFSTNTLEEGMNPLISLAMG